MMTMLHIARNIKKFDVINVANNMIKQFDLKGLVKVQITWNPFEGKWEVRITDENSTWVFFTDQEPIVKERGTKNPD